MSNEIKILTIDNIENIFILQKKVLDSLKNRSLFFPATHDDILQIIKNTGYVLGLFSGEMLIGYATIVFCSLDCEMSKSFGVSSKYDSVTAILDDVAILEQYRGQRYQLLLWNYIVMNLCSNTKYLLTSIHPQNYASLQNAFHFKMKIYCKKTMYYNHPRYIMYREL